MRQNGLWSAEEKEIQRPKSPSSIDRKGSLSSGSKCCCFFYSKHDTQSRDPINMLEKVPVALRGKLSLYNTSWKDRKAGDGLNDKFLYSRFEPEILQACSPRLILYLLKGKAMSQFSGKLNWK